MSAFEGDDPYSSIPDDEAPIPEKPIAPAWNVVTKKKPAKPKEPEVVKTPALPLACKFFKLGKCSAGKGCRFSHDPNAPIAPENGISSSPPTPTLPCKFHAAGYCRNGPKCPFLHATTKKPATTPVPAPALALAPAPAIQVTKPAAQPNGISTIPNPPLATTVPLTNFPTASNTGTTLPNSVFPVTFTPTKQQTSPIPTNPITPIRSSATDAPFPIARSPTTTQQHANIMNIWPASPPVAANSATSLHSIPFFSSSPSSAPSSFSPRHMTNVIPSLASLPSSPSFLSSSPFSMFMSTKPEEDEEDEDDELLPIPGLTIIDDTQDDFVFNPYDDILNDDDDDSTFPMDMSRYNTKPKMNGIHTHPTPQPSTLLPTTHNPPAHSPTPTSTHFTDTPPLESSQPQPRSFADIVKTNMKEEEIPVTPIATTTTTTSTEPPTPPPVTKSTQLLEEEQQMDEMNNKLCQFFVQGICRYGSSCRYIHGNVCDSCMKPCLLVDNPQQNEEHILSCMLHMKTLEERDASKDVECGICYEKTVEKGRRFGLLSHCDHPFCLECIREWRGGTGAPTTTLRSCPICRVTSYYIIPSEAMIFDPARKQDIIDQYKSKLTTITCKYFNNGKGVCKFGTSCMYSHTNPDGTPYVPPTPRKMQDSEGEVTFYNGLKLGAFFDVM